MWTTFYYYYIIDTSKKEPREDGERLRKKFIWIWLNNSLDSLTNTK